MYDNSHELAALISSRICHDLSSPLGAISIGVELLETTGMADTPETILLSESIQAASARLEFFRIAYGPADANVMVSPTLAQKTLSNNYSSTKNDPQWSITQDLPRPMVKLLFLIIQSSVTAMPYGGEITLTQEGAGWSIRSKGRDVRINQDLWLQLENPTPDVALPSSQIQLMLAGLQASSLGHKISYAHTEDSLDVIVN